MTATKRATARRNRRRPASPHKILTRYNETGLEGFTDRSRRPYRHANQLPFQIETMIVRLKQDKPSWGAPKIRERLARLYPEASICSALPENAAKHCSTDAGLTRWQNG